MNSRGKHVAAGSDGGKRRGMGNRVDRHDAVGCVAKDGPPGCVHRSSLATLVAEINKFLNFIAIKVGVVYAWVVFPLTASVPDVEVPRSDVVAARIARKVGPLFGIVWEQNPFGCTWVCDFGRITLAEIARGAPYPARGVQAELDASTGHSGAESGNTGSHAWQPAGRAVWTPRRGPTPASIAHATLNRYGPDTKAAVVLAGANRLLQEVTAAVAEVSRYLAGANTGTEIRLAVWAGLVLEAFRGQPALVAAAIQARAIQRALTTPWGQHLWLPGLADSARCEFGAAAMDGPPADPPGQEPATPQVPTSFDLIDATLPLLGLPLPANDGPLLSQREMLDDIATRWCRRLLQIGYPGRGITWVDEAMPGHRSVQAYVRVGSAIAPFVAEVFSALPIADTPGKRVSVAQVSRLLSGIDVARLSRLSRRAHLITAHVLANYLRFHDDLLVAQPEVRVATRALCRDAANAATRYLGPDDPATLLLAGYAAYCEAWDLSRSGNLEPAVRAGAAADLAKQLDQLTHAWRAGVLDPGTTSYLLEIGVMALSRLDGADGNLVHLWRDAMLARGVDPDKDLDDPATLPAPQRYHLQNYAAFLSSRAASADGLRKALAAQRACVKVREQVTQGELAEYSAKFTSALTSRQAAAAIVGRLLAQLDPVGGTPAEAAEYRDLLDEGVGHARAAIGSPATATMLAADRADPEVIHLALAVLPVVITAWEWQQSDDGAAVLVDGALLADTDRLLRAAADSAVELGPALSDADLTILVNLRRRRGGAGRAAPAASERAAKVAARQP
ncbi:MAG: hypothetical protein JWM19_1675 [Actinomycetia bacterium]|nr:hypothetical protein [Actinomycetes bacterium]